MFDSLVKRGQKIEIAMGMRPKETCSSARKAIRFYRSMTWQYQDKLRVERSPTYYPERKKHACDYKRSVVVRWRKRAYKYREYAEAIFSSPYMLAKHIVYSIFPSHAAPTALRIVGCETGGTYSKWAHNSLTDVRGYFQIQNEWIGETLYYNGRSITVQNNLYDPWYNTLVALYLSHGDNFDWHWAASAHCW